MEVSSRFPEGTPASVPRRASRAVPPPTDLPTGKGRRGRKRSGGIRGFHRTTSVRRTIDCRSWSVYPSSSHLHQMLGNRHPGGVFQVEYFIEYFIEYSMWNIPYGGFHVKYSIGYSIGYFRWSISDGVFQVKYSMGIPCGVFHVEYFIRGIPGWVFHMGTPCGVFQVGYSRLGISYRKIRVWYPIPNVILAHLAFNRIFCGTVSMEFHSNSPIKIIHVNVDVRNAC